MIVKDAPLDPIALNKGTRKGSDAHLSLDKRNFAKPDEWVPERYTTQPKLILDKSAFVPWSIGECYTHFFKN